MPIEDQSGAVGHEHRLIAEMLRQVDFIGDRILRDGQVQEAESLCDDVGMRKERRNDRDGGPGASNVRQESLSW
jgi:hypothetical protein